MLIPNPIVVLSFILGAFISTSWSQAVIKSRTSDCSTGCGKALPANFTPGSTSQPGTITSGGRNREYLIYIPKKYEVDAPAPLILSFHGRTKDAAEQEELSQFSNSKYNSDAVVVYPQGVPNSKGTRQWLGDPDAPSSVNDILFTSDLVASISSAYCINPLRVYATGKSNGGGLCGLLACDPSTSSQIAAFAPVSGAYYSGVLGAPQGKLPDCKTSTSRSKIPFMEFHGYLDKTIKYNGGPDDSDRGSTIGIPAYIDFWVKQNGIESNTKVTETLCAKHGYPPVKRYTWGKGEVQHYNISNLEHDWPSQTPNDDDKDGSHETCFEATEKILEFFNDFTLNS